MTKELLTTMIGLGIIIGIAVIVGSVIINLIINWLLSFGKCRCENPQINYRLNSKGQLVCRDCGGKA